MTTPNRTSLSDEERAVLRASLFAAIAEGQEERREVRRLRARLKRLHAGSAAFRARYLVRPRLKVVTLWGHGPAWAVTDHHGADALGSLEQVAVWIAEREAVGEGVT